jgi:pimeloyl-ACP methyl ester carboxylesterase
VNEGCTSETSLELTVEHVDYRLDVATYGAGEPEIVFVHDGLGSIRQWGDVPERTAVAARLAVMAYNRSGHGTSLPVPRAAWPLDWMSREAIVLASVIERCAAPPVRLVGHSDGGTIALLCALARPSLVSGVVTLAAHSWVEHKCRDAIVALRRDPERLIAALARHHAHPAELFEAWSGAWTSAGFTTWDIRPQLGAIGVDVIVVQGDRDEYATDEMAISTSAAIGPRAELMFVADCRHAIHRDRPDVVIDLAARA